MQPAPDAAISGLAHAIQLSVAPVFLLSGIGAFLGVLTNRLARIIDRARALAPAAAAAAGREGGPVEAASARAELPTLALRSRHINRAIGLCTYSALLIAGVVAALFVGAFAGIDLSVVVAIAFIMAMLALIAGLLSFLAEIHLAMRYVRDAFEGMR